MHQLATVSSAAPLYGFLTHSHAGFWNDINCGLELPSICKRSSDFVNATVAPTVTPTGGCAPEWVSFQGKVKVDDVTCSETVTHKNVHTEIDLEELLGFYLDGFLFLFLASLQCYKFVLGADKRKWQDARSHCVNQGGNLVSILNYREQGKTDMAQHSWSSSTAEPAEL